MCSYRIPHREIGGKSGPPTEAGLGGSSAYLALKVDWQLGQRGQFSELRCWRLVLIVLLAVTRFQLVAVGQDYPIRPVPFTDVKVHDDFWTPRINVNRDVTVPYDFHKCEETGRIANFAIAGRLESGGFRGIFFNDSDVFKVIEGAAYCLAGQPDAKLEQYLDELIAKIAAAQEEDGYLYTARTIDDPNYNFFGRQARWSHLKDGHELYNVGHLYEAAVAHWQTTGKRSLLDVAIKNANLICRVFGPGDRQRVGVPGHQEIEIGLVKLYRVTGDKKYLKQAKFFLDMRGQTKKRKTFGAQYQDHKPVVEQKEAVGHAVRAGYLYAGMADVAALTGDDAYLNAIQGIWENIVSKKMYLTGSVGSKQHSEAFGDNYELPNETAYNETCAAIAQAFFNQRMFLFTGEAKYIDVLERIIYNGFLSGVSISGDRFFYPNPLACNGHSRFNRGVLGRSPWFGTSCCPVNIVRFVPSIAGYVYASTEETLYVNLFIGGSSRVSVADTEVSLRQETHYPWDGKVKLNIDVPHPTEFALRLRIPGWVTGHPLPSDLYRYTSKLDRGYTISLNGKRLEDLPVVNGYAELNRNWKAGDTIELDLPMDVRTVVAHDKVAADRGRVALERGPVVYCSEAVDNGGTVSDLVLPTSANLHAEHRTDLLGGVMVITGQVHRAKRAKDGSIELIPTTLTAIPYYAWAHREVGQMAVWLISEASGATALPRSTIASTSRVSASHVWKTDSAEAVNDQLEPISSTDLDIPRHTWWDKRGTQEWLQYDFAQPQTVTQVDVYWFDDTGRGQCRVPRSWRVLYREGDTWKAVIAHDDYTTAKDTFNSLHFDPVKTTGLKLEVQLQPNYSAGVLEWRVQ